MRDYRNLYIHVPFCMRKCGYCAFYSIPGADKSVMEQWLVRIGDDLRRNAPRLQNLHTVYLGGGTPSVLPPDILAKLFRSIRQYAGLVPGAEITMEANPDTVTPELCDTVSGFVNRVSMGVQSFSPERLKSIGRHAVHPDTAERALQLWNRAGMTNCGIDLIFGLPGETLKQWGQDLQHAVSLPIRHISAYSLMIEEGTPFAATGYVPDDMLTGEMWELAGKFLHEHGFPRYEISNYAMGGFSAQHNVNVWHGETYLGIGPAASSFDGLDRWTEHADLELWLAGEAPEKDVIPRERRLREIFVMGLRTVRGWRDGEFLASTGSMPDFPELEKLEREKLISRDDAGIRATEKGLAFWNEIAMELL